MYYSISVSMQCCLLSVTVTYDQVVHTYMYGSVIRSHDEYLVTNHYHVSSLWPLASSWPSIHYGWGCSVHMQCNPLFSIAKNVVSQAGSVAYRHLRWQKQQTFSLKVLESYGWSIKGTFFYHVWVLWQWEKCSSVVCNYMILNPTHISENEL